MFENHVFQPYAVGNKVYNGGSNSPFKGRVNNSLGIAEKKLSAETRRNAMLRRLQAGNQGNYMNADWLRGSM